MNGHVVHVFLVSCMRGPGCELERRRHYFLKANISGNQHHAFPRFSRKGGLEPDPICERITLTDGAWGFPFVVTGAINKQD